MFENNSLGDFSLLPPEILFNILDQLTAQEINRNRSISKAFKKMIDQIWQPMWEKKFALHFPHLGITQSDNWYQTYRKAYNDEYKKLTKEQRELVLFVKEGKVDELKNLLELGTFKFEDLMDIVTKGNRTLASWAPNQEMLDFFYELALEKLGPPLPIDTTDDKLGTLLHWAILCKQPLAIIRELVEEKKYNVEIRLESDMPSPLHVAMMSNNIPPDKDKDLETVTYLLSKMAGRGGPYRGGGTYRGETPIFLAARNSACPYLFNTLVNAGVELKFHNLSDDSLLHVAAESGHIEAIRVLLDKGLDINKKGRFKETPIFLTVKNISISHSKAFKMLIDAGADLTARDRHISGLLHMAAASGNIEAIETLLKKKLNVNGTNIHGETPIFLAVENAHSDAFNMLVNAKADLNAVDSYGSSLLHVAAASGNIEIIKTLLNKGLDINYAPKMPPSVLIRDGTATPLYAAASAANHENIQFLISNGADINFRLPYRADHFKPNQSDIRSMSNYTLLHKAIQDNNLQAVNALLEYGAESNASFTRDYPNQRFKRKETLSALALALERSMAIGENEKNDTHIKIIESLLKHDARVDNAMSSSNPLIKNLLTQYRLIHQIKEITDIKEKPQKTTSTISFSSFVNNSLEDNITEIMKTITDPYFTISQSSDFKLHVGKLISYLIDNEREVLGRINKEQLFAVIDKVDLDRENQIKLYDALSISETDITNDEMKNIHIALNKHISILEEHSGSRLFGAGNDPALEAAKNLKKWLDGKTVRIAPNQVNELKKGVLNGIYKNIQKSSFYTDANKANLILGEVSIATRKRSPSPKKK